MFNEKDQLAVDTIRALSIDQIESANSGHPGLPMGAAPMAYTLWTKHLNFNPKAKDFFDRDRFILSAGHGSALLYSLLHVSGGLELEELKQFRQWGSKTPGHPEYLHTDGVEITTGPLGQGFAMSVGFAMAEKHLAATYNKGSNVVDHYTYVLASDGDLMEGISHEAASLAGHLKLNKLIALYDSNDISLDGKLNQAFSEDIKGRFEAYGWQHILVKDGNDLNEINAAIETAKTSDRPTIIEVKTIIGFGAPNKQGTNGVHGSPLGADERKLAFEAYGIDPEKKFEVPTEVYDIFQSTMIERATEKEAAWQSEVEKLKQTDAELAAQFEMVIKGELPADYSQSLPQFEVGTNDATRSYSGQLIQSLSASVPSLFGGSADLASSNKSNVKDAKDFTDETPEGKNIWFGVREFAMAAALNGMAAHGGLKVYGATFFVFSDYLKPAVRLSSLMKLPVTYVLTHDSIAVGEDGPTHEPIEQLTGLRAIPNLNVLRPADGNETRVAWQVALESKDRPSLLVLTRQNLPVLDVQADVLEEGVRRGAYIAYQSEQPEVLFVATGSEVSLAIEVAKLLEAEGTGVQVVSMPNMKTFDEQDAAYKEKVLPRSITKRVAIEMGATDAWYKYVGLDGLVIGIDTFGASAPGDLVMEKYGFTKEQVLAKVKSQF